MVQCVYREAALQACSICDIAAPILCHMPFTNVALSLHAPTLLLLLLNETYLSPKSSVMGRTSTGG